MISNLINKIKLMFVSLGNAARQLKSAYPYELKNVSTCSKTGKHLLEIKISGKSQSILYLAEEVVVDDSFIKSFSSVDIRTICYLAACDKYEKILEEEKIKKVFEVLRSRTISGEKTVQLRNKINGETMVIPLKDFAHQDLIERLDSLDVYQIGYLAGQEQTWKDSVKFRVISSKE